MADISRVLLSDVLPGTKFQLNCLGMSYIKL